MRTTNQQWSLTAIDGGYLTFNSTRFLKGSTLVVQAEVDGLQGKGLTASVSASYFELVNPLGTGFIYSFLFALVRPPLAITAPQTNDAQLTLQPYNPADALQQWVFYNATLPSATTDPKSLLKSPIPIPLAYGDTLSPKF